LAPSSACLLPTLAAIGDCSAAPRPTATTSHPGTAAMMHPTTPPAAPALVSPKGKPVALSPLLLCSASPTPTVSAPSTPMLTWQPEPHQKFSRSISGASTIVPDEPSDHPEAIRDGPALTLDGRALDLDGGLAIHFSHDPRLASGFEKKKYLKDGAKFLRASRRLKAAREAEAMIEAGEVCAVDGAGILHGGLVASTRLVDDIGARMKLFRRKRMARSRPCHGDCVACSGPDGRHFWFLSPPTSPRSDDERLRQTRRCLRCEHAMHRETCTGEKLEVFETLCVDTLGLVHFDDVE